MRHTATLLLVASICLICPGSDARAQARSNAVTPTVPLGRVVMIEIVGGARFTGRVIQITAVGVDLKNADGTTFMIPWEHIVRVALGHLPGTRRSWPDKTEMPTSPKQRLGPAWQPKSFYVEGIGLRVTAGVLRIPDSHYSEYGYDSSLVAAGGFEVTLITLHWPHFYWEIFRGIMTYPLAGIGTAMGIPINLDSAGWHQLRIGAHLTANLTYLGAEASAILGASGLQVYYQYRLYRQFAIHVGLQQHSYPFAMTLIFGFST